MPQPNTLKGHALIWITAAVLLAIAFFQCFHTTHDLLWPFDVDFDRDISFVQGTLDGAYGKDPSYLHEYLWYNPLLFLIETVIVKGTGLPINIVLVRAGAWLNLLGPICFFWMCRRLFDARIALAALLSYLFLSSGKILLVLGATYSPWLYPGLFMLFAFFVDIVLCYIAFSRQQLSWFALLGLAVGLTFLGHAAPAIIIVLMMVGLQGGKLLKGLREKEYGLVRRYCMQGLVAFVCFAITAAPIFYFVIGKYHLRILNREPSEYTEGLFYLNNAWGLFKANFNVGFVVAIVGGVWFYRSFPRGLARSIIHNWLVIATGLYLYATLVAFLDHRNIIRLPAMVPAFHYFVYIKAIQSVFFGFGLFFLAKPLMRWFPVVVFLFACCALPFYTKREDFTLCRQYSIAKADDKDKQEVYGYILHNIDADKVILCANDPSLFPVMATGRKMVSTAFTFSNPYVDFEKRESDRKAMLAFIKNNQPAPLRKLLSDYTVSYILLSNDEITPGSLTPGTPVLRNTTYTLFAVR